MMLTPADRLKVHFTLFYPHIKLKHVRMSHVPGFLQTLSGQMIDIRGASYASTNPPLRLWNELHSYFTQHVEVLKRKNSLPTLIVWNGLVYHLDQTRSFKTAVLPAISRRSVPKMRDRMRTKELIWLIT